jgi:hypothetical protein
VYYCSDACAKKDWKKHSVACKAYRVGVIDLRVVK